MLGGSHRCNHGRSPFRLRYEDVLPRFDMCFKLRKAVLDGLNFVRLCFENSAMFLFYLKQSIERPAPLSRDIGLSDIAA